MFIGQVVEHVAGRDHGIGGGSGSPGRTSRWLSSASGAYWRARPSMAGEASVAMTRCPAAVSSRVSRPLPQPSSRTSPCRERTGSSSAKIPGAQARAWKPKPWW